MKGLILSLFLLVTLSLSAQQTIESCGTESVHNRFLQNPNNLQKHNPVEQLIYNAAQNGMLQPSGRADYVLPVVVHIIHNGGSENISDVQAIQAIDYLNQAYRNTSLYDSTVGVDTRIQFCLAKQNPQGQSTSGINRVQSSLTDLDMANDLQMKNLVRWNPNCYVNIWVVKSICSQGSCNIGGYAYFPSAHGGNVDGMVVRASTMGSTPAATGTLIHEAGHYLGLYHTFQGGCSAQGDLVTDTPAERSPNFGCPTQNPDSCANMSGVDPIHNYMDYSYDGCYTEFSAGQSARMQEHMKAYRF